MVNFNDSAETNFSGMHAVWVSCIRHKHEQNIKASPILMFCGSFTTISNVTDLIKIWLKFVAELCNLLISSQSHEAINSCATYRKSNLRKWPLNEFCYMGLSLRIQSSIWLCRILCCISWSACTFPHWMHTLFQLTYWL